MKLRILAVVLAVLAVATLTPPAVAQKDHPTVRAVHNFGKRHVQRSRKYVRRKIARTHRAAHHKAAKARNWLDHH